MNIIRQSACQNENLVISYSYGFLLNWIRGGQASDWIKTLTQPLIVRLVPDARLLLDTPWLTYGFLQLLLSELRITFFVSWQLI